jgi:hypothetical protein
VPALFFFPAAIIYITYGLVRSVMPASRSGSRRDPLIDEDETEERCARAGVRGDRAPDDPAATPGTDTPRAHEERSDAVPGGDPRHVPREGILDPQGKAVGGALRALGFAASARCTWAG